MTGAPRVAVVGGGAVGSAVALRLVLDGCAVTLFDPDADGRNASYGNAGHIGAASIVPWANPAHRRAAMAYRRDPMHPLRFSYGDMARNARWVARWLRASTTKRAERGGRALKSLLDTCYDTLEPLLKASDTTALLQRRGILHVFENASAFEVARAGFEQRRSLGVPVEFLSPTQLYELEPLLDREGLAVHGAVLLPTIGQVTDPGALLAGFRRATTRRGGVVRAERVRRLDADGGGVGVETAEGGERFDACVVAAGIRSPGLAKGLGARVPIIAERGYHVQFDDAPAPSRPILFVDRRVVFSPMRRGLRMTTGAEFTGPDRPPDHAFMRRIFQSARPLLRDAPELEAGEAWMGSRPTSPDSLPIIGRAPKARNVVLAYGHGHSGLTMAALTAAIVSALLRDRPAPIDIAPFRPDRGA